jgi:energy-converting hydrogenase Eha subunit A
MWDMAKSSIILFFRGRLFAEPSMVFRQTAIGAAITAIIVVALAKIGLPLVASAALGGLIGGALQPYLFKNLKYR